jgi:electron transport complex protein RnfB
MLATRILAALPQTQCTRCGYADCAAYASAIASSEAAINQCPPGGAQGIERLARLTGLAIAPLNPDNGFESQRLLAVIDENWCIGCTLCIEVCPTDAIFGSNKRMHAVMESYCTGCELCIPVCPVDCIQLESVSGHATGWDAWSVSQAEVAGSRYELHRQRLGYETGETASGARAAPDAPPDVTAEAARTTSSPPDKKAAAIEAAMQRARASRRSHLGPSQS